MSTLDSGPAVTALRLARGLTQSELAKKSGVSQAVLSKIETGTMPLDGARADAFATALDVPSTFFDHDGFGVAETRTFHRKLASLPITVDKRIRAEAGILQAQIHSLVGDQLPPLNLIRQALPEDGYFNAADVARSVREAWGLAAEPVPNLVDLAERAGIIVLRHDMKSLRLDAIATWPASGVPVILLADRVPGDRQRFTMAHELGHAVMHDIPSENQEIEADQFASEFLMPRSAMLTELRDLSMNGLASMKRRWGVSMAALARRARDLGLMTETAYRNFNIQMSSSGMKKREPVTVDPESPSMLRSMIMQRLARGETTETLAEAAFMNEDEFANRFLESA